MSLPKQNKIPHKGLQMWSLGFGKMLEFLMRVFLLNQYLNANENLRGGDGGSQNALKYSYAITCLIATQ